MGRNCINRHIEFMPSVKGFKPLDRCVKNKHRVKMTLDEFEAIRLLDYLHKTQEEAAVLMQISRPTLTRIYEKARIKYATALVEGCVLLIEGGDIQINKRIFLCHHCHHRMTVEELSISHCPQCNSDDISDVENSDQDKVMNTKNNKEEAQMPNYDTTGPYGTGRPGKGFGPCGQKHKERGEHYRFGRRNRCNTTGSENNLYDYNVSSLKEREIALQNELKWLEQRIKELEENK